MKILIKKVAFTLTEVLITLTIIGVISVLTVPNLNNALEKKKIEIGVAKSWELLNNVIARAQFDHGSVEGWTYGPHDSWGSNTNARIFAQKYLMPYMKVVSICPNANTGKCFAGPRNQWYSANGYEICNYQSRDAYMFVLANGMSVAVLNRASGMYNYVKVVVDIDGPNKGGSIMGRDVFYYSLGTFYPSTAARAACQNPDRKRYPLSPGVPHNCGTTGFFISNESLKNDFLRNAEWFSLYKESNSDCGNQNCGASAGCEAAVHIMKNNFKIPDYYPLDKIAKKHR